MTSKRTSTTVFATLPGDSSAVPAGELRLLEEGAQLLASSFVYGLRYVKRPNALEVDPISLAFGAAPPAGPEERSPVNGLVEFGAIRDAAPDLWGRRVIENKLGRAGPLPESVYLEHAGPNRVGALEFRARPDSRAGTEQIAPATELQYLLEASARIEAGEPVPARLAAIFDAGSSMGGARPKAVVLHEGSQWLAKFSSSSDRFNVPAVERATLELARTAGMRVPRTRLVPLSDGAKVMLIERFDRIALAAGFGRVHFVSALTMLGLDESRSPHAAYADIASVLSQRSPAANLAEDRVELYRRMVFNIMVGNDDDHLRNHGFLREGAGWRLAPLYDVAPKPQVGFERFLHLAVGPRAGRAATLVNAVSGSGAFGLTPAQAAAEADAVARVVRQWQGYFEAWGVAGADIDAVAGAFRPYRELGWSEVERLLARSKRTPD